MTYRNISIVRYIGKIGRLKEGYELEIARTSEMHMHQGHLVSIHKGWEKEEEICLPFPVPEFLRLATVQVFV